MAVVIDGTNNDITGLVEPLAVGAAVGASDAVPLAQLNTLMTAQATTSGTSIDFTGIPSWVKRITVMLNGVSTNGTSPLQIQLGDSGGIETTGYASTSGFVGAGTGATTSTTGLLVSATTGAATVFTGNIEIVASSGVDWTSSGVFGRTDTYIFAGGGGKTLSGTLDRLRLTTVNGTDTFDAGSVNVMYS